MAAHSRVRQRGRFTAAGDVRRGLETAGFKIERLSGFGHKRHRIVGKIKAGQKRREVVTRLDKVAVIGAGLLVLLSQLG